MLADDPWYWSVDELVEQVCGSQKLFSEAGYAPPTCLNPGIYESLFRTQRYGGELFMDVVHDGKLKDLGFQDLNQRQALLAVVRLLRSRSIQYNRKSGTIDALPHNPLNPNGEITFTDANGRKRRKINLTPVSQSTIIREQGPNLQGMDLASAENHGSGSKIAPGEWDFLLNRYKNGDPEDEGEELPGNEGIETEIDSEEESETEEDGIDDAEEEPIDDMEIDDQPGAQKTWTRRKRMSVDEVADVINDCIAEFTEAWFPGKVDEEDVDAEAQPTAPQVLLRKAGSESERLALAGASRYRIDYLGEYLDTLAEAIATSPWSRPEAIRRQCSSLIRTVESLEYEKWLLEFWESKHQGTKNEVHEVIDLGSGSDPSDTEDEETGNVELVLATDRLSVGISSQTMPTAMDGSTPVHGDRPQLKGPNLQVKVPHQSQGPPQLPSQNSPPSHTSPQLQYVASPQLKSQAIPQLKPSRPLYHGFDGPPISQSPSSEPAQKPSGPPSPRPPQSQSRLQSQKSQQERSKPAPVQLHNKESPEFASISTVVKWSWKNLVETSDRKRIIMKIIYEMKADDREILRTRITSVRKQNILMEIPRCIAMLLRGKNKIPGVLQKDMPNIVSFTKLFLSWWLAGNYFDKEAEQWRLEELAQCLDERVGDPDLFYDWVKYVLAHTFSREALSKPLAPSQAEIIVISDSDDDVPKPRPKVTLTFASRKKLTNKLRPVQKASTVDDTVVILD